MEDMSDINRKRLEKDLAELKKMIAAHFEQRKLDEEELTNLSERIEKRKKVREEQTVARAAREKERAEREKIEKARREEEEKKKQEEDDAKKKAALAAMSIMGGSQNRPQRQRRGGDKEKKKKVLAERRKQLNVDHLTGEKLQEKAIELHKWLTFLEESKLDFEQQFEDQKYELKSMRLRVNELMSKGGSAKKVNIRK